MSVQKHTNNTNNIYYLFLLSFIFMITPLSSTDITTPIPITTTNTTSLSLSTISRINQLIRGEIEITHDRICQDMGLTDCTYFDTSQWSNDINSPYTPNLYCNSSQICILTCDEAYSCHHLDIYASSQTILLIDCIKPYACKQLSIHASQASFVHLQANSINSITNSQIQCPQSHSNIINSHHKIDKIDKNCVIHAGCRDMYGDEHCDREPNVEFNDAMIYHLSIYADNGYTDVSLECNFSDVSVCFTHSIIVCGTTYTQRYTCWVDYDVHSGEYVCEGDVQCNNRYNMHINTTSTTNISHSNTSNDGGGHAANISDSESENLTTLMRLIRDILMKKNMILYVSITLLIMLCFCCICCILVCKFWRRNKSDRDVIMNKNDAKREFKFVQKQKEKQNNVKYKKHSYKLCKKCTAKSCLCYYLSCCCCCYCCQCLYNLSTPKTHLNHSKNTEKHMTKENHTHHNTVADEPQTINPLSIDQQGGIFPSFFVKNREKNQKKRIISPSHSGTNISNDINDMNVELVVMANNKLHPPTYLSHIQPQSHTNTPSFNNNLDIHLHKLQQQQSLSSQQTHNNVLERGTFSRSFETHTKQRSSSHTSHHDGLEEQAAKKIGDAKLGTNTGHNTHGNTPHSTPFLANDAHAGGVTAHAQKSDVTSGDFAYAFQLQQQQLFEAAQVNTDTPTKTPTCTHDDHETSPTNGDMDTPATDTGGNVQVQTTDGSVLDIGGGFKIGIEESTSSTHTSITDSRSSKTFDPEHPSSYD